jgi:hypothetical protein
VAEEQPEQQAQPLANGNPGTEVMATAPQPAAQPSPRTASTALPQPVASPSPRIPLQGQQQDQQQQQQSTPRQQTILQKVASVGSAAFSPAASPRPAAGTVSTTQQQEEHPGVQIIEGQQLATEESQGPGPEHSYMSEPLPPPPRHQAPTHVMPKAPLQGMCRCSDAPARCV